MEPELQIKLMMLGLWLYLVYKSGPNLFLSIKSKKWKKSSSIVTTSSFDRTGNSYSPKLIYKYAFNGREFMNDTFTYLGTSSISKSNAIKIAQLYPEGSSMEIWVNPEKPEQSVVIPGVHWMQYVSLLILTLFCLSVAYIVPILNYIWPGCEPNCT
ncbi:DUF3592 domain-containing protein [Shewanella sp. A25]|nr:DUF3592 domain-containing protein [Shewanella shenzhenensis]